MISTKESPSKSRPVVRQSVAVPAKQLAKPTLSEVVSLICQDSATDALLYLMRSNTGHDGE